MNRSSNTVAHRGISEDVFASNKVIRNTYLLLSMTLLFSAATAGMSMVYNIPYPGFGIVILGYIGFLFLIAKLRNSIWGIVSVFGFTGFMGMTLGPIINAYVSHFANGTQLVMTALGGAGVIFISLSAYALTTRKDFSFLGGFVMVGVLVAFCAGIGALIFNLPTLSLAVSAMFILLMSGHILYHTSAMIHGGERNYIMATVMLYITIYNLFLNLLHLLAVFSGRE